jgi:hypothetical protein
MKDGKCLKQENFISIFIQRKKGVKTKKQSAVSMSVINFVNAY